MENLSGGNFWSGNLAMRREMFVRLGGFDEDFLEAGGEDMEFGDRIRRSGVRTTFCTAATVVHPSHVVTWRYLFWRTFLMKWHLLYLLKTGQSVPREASALRAVGHVIVWRTMALARATWRSCTVRNESMRRTMYFDLLAVDLFPALLPYLTYGSWSSGAPRARKDDWRAAPVQGKGRGCVRAMKRKTNCGAADLVDARHHFVDCGAINVSISGVERSSTCCSNRGRVTSA